MKNEVKKFHVTVIKNCGDHGTGLSGIPLSVRACFPISDRVWNCSAAQSAVRKKINRRWKIKRGILSALLVLLVFVVAGGLLGMAGYALISQAKKLVQNYDSVAAQGTQVWNLCCQRVEELCGIQNGYVEHCVSSYVPMLWQKCRTDVVPKLMNYSIGYVKGFLVGFTIFIVIMVSTILILADYPNIRKKAVDHPIGNLIYRIGRNMKKGRRYLFKGTAYHPFDHQQYLLCRTFPDRKFICGTGWMRDRTVRCPSFFRNGNRVYPMASIQGILWTVSARGCVWDHLSDLQLYQRILRAKADRQ